LPRADPTATPIGILMIRSRRAALIVGVSALLLAAPAAAMAATLTPTTADFGSVPLRTTSATKSFTLTATEPTFTVNPVTRDDAFLNQFRLVSEDCPQVLTAGSTCTLTVSFVPVVAGSATGALLANGINPNSERSVLRGWGGGSKGKKKCKKGKKKCRKGKKKGKGRK
jgi:hypothetical protein